MTDDQFRRIQRKVFERLAAAHPGHPWLASPEAQAALAPRWGEPRRVAEWLWLEIERYTPDGRLDRVGRVSWSADGSGAYQPSVTIESARGLGLYCWPSFRSLSEAQEFVETLLALPLDALRARHGRQWPNVVLG